MDRTGIVRCIWGLVVLLSSHGVSAQPPSREAWARMQRLAAEDHRQMMDLLGIKSLRPGRNGSDPNAPNFASYDESKANPFPKLPDPLVLKNGQPVTSASMWWERRRPEIVEDFDREIYGRAPANTPDVTWEVIRSKEEKKGEVPVVTKELVGHVDNASYSAITVNIQATLTVPANAVGSVPVIMEFGFVGPFAWPSAGGASLLRRDWGEIVENLAGSGEYHWMAGNFLKYAGPLEWGDLPVDAHELICLCAPRPVFIGSGSNNGDAWVDAKGMFMAAVEAGPVYRLLGRKAIGTAEFPPMETSLITGDVAFRQHSGGHTPGPNWPAFLTFAGRYLHAGPRPERR